MNEQKVVENKLKYETLNPRFNEQEVNGKLAK